MKKLIIAVLLLLFSLLAFAGSLESMLKKDVMSRFSGSKNIKVVKIGDLYSVSFYWNQLESEAQYDAAGKFLQVSTNYPTAKIPAGIQKSVKNHYDQVMFLKAVKIQKQKVITWKLEILSGDNAFRLILNDRGKILSREEFLLEEEPDMGC